jgi:hypothetical protein
MTQLIQLKRGNAADLLELNPAMAEGEIIIELDTGRIKVGNGALTWNELPYATDGFEYTAVVNIEAVAGLRAELDDKQPAGDYALDTDPRLENTRDPNPHGHAISDVAGLQDALDLRQPAGNYAELTTPPASATSSGVPGSFAYNSSFFYVCVAPNTWVRAALATWS